MERREGIWKLSPTGDKTVISERSHFRREGVKQRGSRKKKKESPTGRIDVM